MNEANISIARIDNEEGFIRHYNFLHDKSTLNIGDLLESFIFICYNMEGNIEYGGENYLQILLRLISFNREIAVLFVERWRKAVEDITINYIGFGMHIVIPQNSLGIIFITCISDRNKVEFILNLFKRKFNLQTVISVAFNKDQHPKYMVEWMLSEDYAYEETLLDEIIQDYDPWESTKRYQKSWEDLYEQCEN